MNNKNQIKKDDTFLIEYINDDTHGKLAHFFSMNEGNYYSRVIENNDILIYDRLSYEEEKEFISNLDLNEYDEVWVKWE